MAAHTHNNSKQATPAKVGSERAGWIQRACACGQHTLGGIQCEACNKKRLQRRATSSDEISNAPSIVEETLRTGGQPLDKETRAFMETRFAHDFSRVQAHRPAPQRLASGLAVGPANDEFEREADRVAASVMKREKSDESNAHANSPRADFSRVRVHTGERAAESARMLDAVAYTVGHDVVFDAGQYAPSTPKGRELLAHELAHVVQQTGGSQASASNVVQSKKRERIPVFSSIYDFFSNIVQFFSPGFEPETLQEYLDTIIETGLIEDSSDSDNKAYEVFKLWKNGKDKTTIVVGTKPYPLTDKLRKLLSEELRSGGSAEQKSAAKEFDDFKPEKSAKTEAPATPTATQEAPSGDSLTKTEEAASKMREALRGQVETKTKGGKKYQVGGIEADKATQEDIKQRNLLLGKEDTAHIEFFDRKLGMDTSYTTPRDAFRWNLLKEIIATGKVDLMAISEDEEFMAKDAIAGRIAPASPKTLRGLTKTGAKGVTVYREELYKLVGATSAPGAKDLVSMTGRDQVFYSKGYISVAHELFGHLWLAMQGVPSGHGDSLKGTHTIKDPFGEPFKGTVDDYINEYIQLSPQLPARKGQESPSRTLDASESKFKDAVKALVTALSATDAFMVTLGFTKPSKEVGNRWVAVEKLYNMLLLNEANEGQRISFIVSEVKKVYDNYDDNFTDAFERFLFTEPPGWSTMRTNPKRHLAAQLKIEDPTNRPPRKKKKSAPQPATQGKVHPKLFAPYGQEFAPPEVHAALRSTGRPLESTTRNLMESRFQHDFSRVRVHTGEQAAESAQAINALAYTVGSNIVFGRGQYAPQTSSGQRLLAHELTHTLQQQQQPSGTETNLKIAEADDSDERRADDVAGAVTEAPLSGRGLGGLRPAASPARSPLIQRQKSAQGSDAQQKKSAQSSTKPARQSAPLDLKGLFSSFLEMLRVLDKKLEGHATQSRGLTIYGSGSGKDGPGTQASKDAHIWGSFDFEEFTELMDFILSLIPETLDYHKKLENLREELDPRKIFKDPVKAAEFIKGKAEQVEDIQDALGETKDKKGTAVAGAKAAARTTTTATARTVSKDKTKDAAATPKKIVTEKPPPQKVEVGQWTSIQTFNQFFMIKYSDGSKRFLMVSVHGNQEIEDPGITDWVKLKGSERVSLPKAAAVKTQASTEGDKTKTASAGGVTLDSKLVEFIADLKKDATYGSKVKVNSTVRGIEDDARAVLKNQKDDSTYYKIFVTEWQEAILDAVKDRDLKKPDDYAAAIASLAAWINEKPERSAHVQGRAVDFARQGGEATFKLFIKTEAEKRGFKFKDEAKQNHYHVQMSKQSER